jgi:anti-sigma factor RsiW
MKTHQAVQAKLPLAATGELGSGEQLLVEEHLRACPDCAAELARLQQLIQGLHRLPEPRLPAYLLERTLKRVELQTAISAERRSENVLMMSAVVIGWLSNVAVWLLLSYVVGGGPWRWWAYLGVSTALSWSAAGVAVLLVSGLKKTERRSYAMAS